MARGATPIVSVGVARTGAAQNSFAIDPASSGGVVLAWQMSPQARSSMKDGRKTWPGKEEDGPEGIEKWGRTSFAIDPASSGGVVLE